MLKADGFDKAVIGVGSRCGQKDIIAYDRDECIAILCRCLGRGNHAYIYKEIWKYGGSRGCTGNIRSVTTRYTLLEQIN